jgi:DNA-binding SARP family transcriptional activator
MPYPRSSPSVKAASARSGVEQNSSYELVLIGGWKLSRGDECVHLAPSAQRLLAFVALNDHVNRAFVAGTLWPEVSEDHAQASLRTGIWRVLSHCPGILINDKDILALSARTSVDVWRLRALSEALVEGLSDEVELGKYGEPLSGDLLPGWYEDWVMLERERLRQVQLHILETMTRSLAGRGRYGKALELAMAAVHIAPLRESAHREIIRIHLAQGNVAEALRQFELCAHLLRDDLGLEPSEQMIDLMRPVIENTRRPPATR